MEDVRLRINMADITSEKMPSLIFQILLQGLPFPSASCEPMGKTIDLCWVETIVPKERAEAIVDILKLKGIRAETKHLKES